MSIAVPCAPLYRAPDKAGLRDSDMVLGTPVTCYEQKNGWAWVQNLQDGYVGYTPDAGLQDGLPELTHRVTVPMTLLFARPDIKSEPLTTLPLGADVRCTGDAVDHNASYLEVEAGQHPRGFIVSQHLARLPGLGAAPDIAGDWVAYAEQLAGVPYLWGGASPYGLDCSGLMQIALKMAGHFAPRDADMQERALGHPCEQEVKALASGRVASAGLQRGDLVFWPGHVGVMQNAETLLHANAHHMATASEPLAEALARFAQKDVNVRTIRRF